MFSDWSEGNTQREWEILKEKYEGCKDSNKLDLQRELLTSKLEIEMDPDVWMTKLENIMWDIESSHRVVSTETEFLNQIVTLLPEEYNTLYHSFSNQLDSKSEPLTIYKARKQLNNYYNREIKTTHMNRINRVMNFKKEYIPERTKWGKYPWCYSKIHGLSDCTFSRNNDRSMYRCKNGDKPHHDTPDCVKMKKVTLIK